MKDRHLFRGKTGDNWAVGPLSYGAGDFHDSHSEQMPYIRQHPVHYNPNLLKDTAYCIDPTTLGQCTGLKDKNCKLIFEGDIIRFFINGKNAIGIVKWFDDVAGFLISNTNNSWIEPLERYEVCIIGNSHDNPELLEADAE